MITPNDFDLIDWFLIAFMIPFLFILIIEVIRLL